MVRATLGVTIQRPVHDVFAVLANVENVPRWSHNTIEEKLLTPGPLRVGSRRRAVIRSFGGRTMTNVAEMIDIEEDRRMVIDFIDTPIPARIVIDYLATDSGTRLDWTVEFKPRGWWRPASPLLVAFYRWAFQKDLDNLKLLMEAGRL
jgi:uncharacterized protein YndB with AHSA1/START domain